VCVTTFCAVSVFEYVGINLELHISLSIAALCLSRPLRTTLCHILNLVFISLRSLDFVTLRTISFRDLSLVAEFPSFRFLSYQPCTDRHKFSLSRTMFFFSGEQYYCNFVTAERVKFVSNSVSFCKLESIKPWFHVKIKH